MRISKYIQQTGTTSCKHVRSCASYIFFGAKHYSPSPPYLDISPPSSWQPLRMALEEEFDIELPDEEPVQHESCAGLDTVIALSVHRWHFLIEGYGFVSMGQSGFHMFPPAHCRCWDEWIRISTCGLDPFRGPWLLITHGLYWLIMDDILQINHDIKLALISHICPWLAVSTGRIILNHAWGGLPIDLRISVGPGRRCPPTRLFMLIIHQSLALMHHNP